VYEFKDKKVDYQLYVHPTKLELISINSWDIFIKVKKEKKGKKMITSKQQQEQKIQKIPKVLSGDCVIIIDYYMVLLAPALSLLSCLIS